MPSTQSTTVSLNGLGVKGFLDRENNYLLAIRDKDYYVKVISECKLGRRST